MREALLDARLDPAAIDYINAHASGTQVNDSNEAMCIHEVFGERARPSRNSVPLPVSGTKAFTAHPLGATGAIESIICALALERGYLPPTLHHRVPDPACDLDIVPNIGRPALLQKVMNNAFGFGGINASLILGKG
jgi:3-oxoacyl-[acyl-carrier-protein] synthase II